MEPPPSCDAGAVFLCAKAMSHDGTFYGPCVFNELRFCVYHFVTKVEGVVTIWRVNGATIAGCVQQRIGSRRVRACTHHLLTRRGTRCVQARTLRLASFTDHAEHSVAGRRVVPWREIFPGKRFQRLTRSRLPNFNEGLGGGKGLGCQGLAEQNYQRVERVGLKAKCQPRVMPKQVQIGATGRKKAA